MEDQREAIWTWQPLGPAALLSWACRGTGEEQRQAEWATVRQGRGSAAFGGHVQVLGAAGCNGSGARIPSGRQHKRYTAEVCGLWLPADLPSIVWYRGN